MIKNAGTKAAKAVRRLHAGQKLALTGTPVENRLSELWAILDAVNPGLLGQPAPLPRAVRDGDRAQRRSARRRPACARSPSRSCCAAPRPTGACCPTCPTRSSRSPSPSSPASRRCSTSRSSTSCWSTPRISRGCSAAVACWRRLTRLKQICNHPAQALKDGSRLAGRSGKLTRFDELVEELLDVDERALVFTQFREMGDLLQTPHRATGSRSTPAFLHGGVSRSGRDRMVADFQDGAGAPLLLVSLKAGGTGLNLTAASQVIHYDRWWNPAVEDQATDRAWRIGQQRTVNVHKLVCQGTVEERIGEVIDEKRALADAVVGTGEAWLSELSTDELARLVMLEGA